MLSRIHSCFSLYHSTGQPTCDGAQLRRDIDIVENVTINSFKYLLTKLPSLENNGFFFGYREQAEINAKLDTHTSQQAKIKDTLTVMLQSK